MTGIVLPFRRHSLAPGKPAPGRQRVKLGLALAMTARPGAVSIVIGDTELWIEPAQARELGHDLLELATEAERPR